MLSKDSELKEIAELIKTFLYLPFFTNVPGLVLENIIANVKQANVLNTYDFIDVLDGTNHVGWQIKSVKSSTPVTWKRAKISNKQQLILASEHHESGVAALGRAIIDFCNHNLQESVTKYQLQHVVYARLIDKGNNRYTYFEKELSLTRLFNPDDFIWRWSEQKNTSRKEQLSALHGIHKHTGESWFSWHGRGENQLHFKAEYLWWPTPDSHCYIDFIGPAEKLSIVDLRKIIQNEPLD